MSILHRYLATTFIFTVLSAPMIANAALVSRLGGQAYYDDQLDITWLADADAGAGSAFDDGPSTTDGRMTWANASAWAASLTIGGVSDWRLPNQDINDDGSIAKCALVTKAACMDNEYGHLYFYGAGTVLGNGVTEASPGSFSNIQLAYYWSATDYAPDPNDAWIFYFYDGNRHWVAKNGNQNAWAVHDGDIAAVPLPAAVWLFGSGLIGLIGLARRKKS